MAIEFETKLIICTQDAKSVLDRIGSLPSIGTYQLIAGNTHRIRDQYFDTPGYTLKQNKIALRLREDEASSLLCMKKEGLPTQMGGIRRIEIEAPWSRECLEEIIETIGESITFKIKIDIPSNINNPIETLKALNMIVIQGRQTTRSTLHIIDPNIQTSPVIAELALDTVLYQFEEYKIIHYEVEIEAKKEEYETQIIDLTKLLKQKYNDSLRPWNHNKLITGLAMDELSKKGIQLEFHEDTNNLNSSSYDIIESYIRQPSES